MCIPATRPGRVVATLLVLLCTAVLLAACGGDDDSGDDASAAAAGTTSAGPATAADGGAVDPQAAAETLAECTTAAGLEGTVTTGSVPNAIPVDLTTETATIVVQVLATAKEAKSYESASGLDQEVVDNYVIVGAAIPKRERDIVTGCIPG